MRNRAFLAQLTGAIALVLTLACAVGQASSAGITITDLGTLTGGSVSSSGGINALGQVAGMGDSSIGIRAFLSDGGPLQDLGTLGGSQSLAYGINAAGQVVGQARTVLNRRHAFIWDAVLGMQDLGTLTGGNNSTAFAINVAGQVVGESNLVSSPFSFHGFLWSSGAGMVDLGTLTGGSFSIAYDINDSGQIVGEGDDASGGTRALLWNSVGVPQDLGTLPGGTFARARAINNLGQAVGWGNVTGGATHAFLWDPVAGFTDLGTLPGGSDSWAFGLNDLGQVVGQAVTSAGDVNGFVWDAVGGMQPLAPLTGGTTSVAVAINNFRQVAGESDSGTAPTHAVRWQLNRPPVAAGGTVTTPQDTPIAVTLAGSDPDGDGLAFTVVTPPSHGTLSGLAPNLLYTPNPGWSGSDAFTFTVSDGTVSSAAATVSVTVVATAPPPDDAFTRIKGQGDLDGQHHFVFRAGTGPGGPPVGSLQYWHPAGGGQLDGFVTTSIVAATFGSSSVVFSGLGRWNGLDGHTFEARAVDAGEPGRGNDSFAIVIKAPDGTTVASAGGLLSAGNVQSVTPNPVAAANGANGKKK